MTPKEYKQMMNYLTRSGVRKQVKFASDIARHGEVAGEDYMYASGGIARMLGE